MPVYVLTQDGLARATALSRTAAEGKASGVDIAEVCRNAGNAFCAGAASTSWGKRGLAEWLLGHYASATSLGSQPERTSDGGGGPRTPAIADGDVRKLLKTTLSDVYDALERTMLGCPPDFVRPLIRDRILVSAGKTETLWVPIDRRRLSLAKRVLSLFAVDKLLRPEDYANPFALCARCGAVLLDEKNRNDGLCPEHNRPSGVAPRAPRHDET